MLDLFEASGDKKFLAGAQGAGRWIKSLAVPVLEHDRGLDWPVSEDGQTPAGPFWCHGAAGIGQFFLHAARIDALLGAAELAHRAAQTVISSGRWAGPTQCHGLAGSIEFLLDTAQATGERSYFAGVRSFAQLLEAFAAERNGMLLWPSDSPTAFTPGYMVGYAGIGACLVRLGDPEHLPRQFSRSGFRH